MLHQILYLLQRPSHHIPHTYRVTLRYKHVVHLLLDLREGFGSLFQIVLAGIVSISPPVPYHAEVHHICILRIEIESFLLDPRNSIVHLLLHRLSLQILRTPMGRIEDIMKQAHRYIAVVLLQELEEVVGNLCDR